MKKAEYMTAHVGEKFTGIISSVKGFGFYVTLPNTVEGYVRVESLYDGYYRYDEGRMALINEKAHVMYRVGDTIDVQCVSASKASRSVEFGVVRERGGKIQENAQTSSGKKRKTRSRSARKAELYGNEEITLRKGKKSRKANGRRKK
jgi:ribonuclease R